MLEQVRLYEEIAGKTISHAVELWSCNDVAVFVFTDGTFFAVKSKGGYDGESELHTTDDFDIFAAPADKIIDAGIITKEELAERRAQRDEEWNRRTENRARAEYERLKKQFEG
jgi:ADP-ribosylglycohydrolase